MPPTELAIVVGAAGAIGSVITQQLAETGLSVLAVGRDRDKLADLARRNSPAVAPCVADISDDRSITEIGEHIAGRTVAMVVHAPGVPVAGGVLSVSTDAVMACCNIKAGGFLRLVRAAEPGLRRGSRLIAIGGHYGFEPSPYAATAGIGNAALTNLVRQMSWAYGDRGITAHLLAPGPADTERLRKVAADRAFRSGQDVEEELDAIRKESAIGALTEPAQVAWAVRMLLAPEADALAGSSIMLDSGRRRGLP
jgi:NAD(P)-dependent dehydrogenase (short-subunit alcohol dehydrogenase family)